MINICIIVIILITNSPFLLKSQFTYVHTYYVTQHFLYIHIT